MMKKDIVRAADLAWWLRALAVLSEDQSSIPSTQTDVTPVSGESDRTRHPYCTQTYMHAKHSYT